MNLLREYYDRALLIAAAVGTRLRDLRWLPESWWIVGGMVGGYNNHQSILAKLTNTPMSGVAGTVWRGLTTCKFVDLHFACEPS